MKRNQMIGSLALVGAMFTTFVASPALASRGTVGGGGLHRSGSRTRAVTGGNGLHKSGHKKHTILRPGGGSGLSKSGHKQRIVTGGTGLHKSGNKKNILP